METWFLKHVFGLSLSVLLLGLPGPLGARPPANNSTSPVTEGFHSSAATDEPSHAESVATSTSYSSESLSPSQRNLLLSHGAETHAGNSDTAQTKPFTETSSMSLGDIGLSTEPLASTLVTTTEAGSSSTSSSSSSSSTNSSSSGGGSTSSSSTSSGSSSSSGGGSGSTSSSSSTSSGSSSSSGGSTSSSSTSSGLY
ncbi:uncharacterized protein DDB_G0271670-like [Mugil cephalus]|uniref:uncharacterized protein DDB_G0271670-like n=1 Tax=Mugil cephalus TaxID=48193 RepID=UPI001FB5837A|nr:uncharacterized protein DDB_G0271670-like [Mugil cephalus]